MSIDLYVTAGNLAVGGEMDVQVGYLLAIVAGTVDGTITFDAAAAGGKGQFKGGSKVIQAVADAGNVMPTEFRGIVSKGCKVLRAAGAELLVAGLSNEARFDAVTKFVRAHGGISAYYAVLFPSEKKETSVTLAQMVANLLAWSVKNDIEASSVVAEVLAQVQG